MDIPPQQQSNNKLPPQSLEAEQSVLGALLLDNRAWDKVADRVKSTDFYRKDHQIIFEAIVALAERGKPFDTLTVAERLKETEKLNKMGGEAALYELANNTPSAANVVAYADIVRERSVLRELISTGTDITDSAFKPEGRDAQELLDKAEELVFKISQHNSRGKGPVPISQLLPKTTDRIDTLYHAGETITGVATGFSDFDALTSGLQRGDLIVVAGRPSMGKTALAMNVAEYAAIKGDKPVLIFSLEMPAEQLTMRMMSSLGRIDQHKVRTGKLEDDDWPRITSAVSMLSEAKMYIDDTPALTPIEIRSRARRVARENDGLGLIVVDYMQLMQVSGSGRENRATEVSEISRSLKAVAKELDVPLIALSQLNRSLEARSDKRPVMSDLRDSGSIEQDADVIIFIYRDEVYHEDSPDKGKAEIIIRKQRNGPIGDFHLTFLGKYTRFENFMPQMAPAGAYA
ncbi:MAG: replicative DNA helicase [Gammaproteobacteria bacterium]|nr:replicative DNA helicase [Gammaproteobacteria bacterium]